LYFLKYWCWCTLLLPTSLFLSSCLHSTN
jgi:hypothetical protein